jgi:succinate dehydrogenase / fumarate reductase flavoprotein subunit
VVGDAVGTVIQGLYAAGECACVSVHGANRLGTNSLLDIVVFGKRGGAAMAEYVTSADMPEPVKGAEDDVRDRIDKVMSNTGGEKVGDLRSRLQEEMQAKASVFRTGESLHSCLVTIQELQQAYEKIAIDDKGAVFNYDLAEALELGYLLDLAESLVVSGEARTESRGAHSRDDFPNRDDANWMKHTLAFRGADGTVTLDYKPVIGGAYLPMERKY